MNYFNLLGKIQAALLIEGETLVMAATLTIICKVGAMTIGVIVTSRFSCCVILALSWNTAGGGDCI